jgi:DNA-binding GntR family transcriptional regulator
MIAATALPGRYPLAVALVIRFRAGLEKTGSKLRLTSKMLERFGINRQAGYRALATLKDAGLVIVDRKSGRCPLVSIREKRTKRKTKGN